jgi:hypothetical protein
VPAALRSALEDGDLRALEDQRIDAHAQPGELLHRPDELADLEELWAEAMQARDGSRADR